MTPRIRKVAEDEIPGALLAALGFRRETEYIGYAADIATRREELLRHRRRRRLERRRRRSSPSGRRIAASLAGVRHMLGDRLRQGRGRQEHAHHAARRGASRPRRSAWRSSTPTSTVRARRAWRASGARRSMPGPDGLVLPRTRARHRRRLDGRRSCRSREALDFDSVAARRLPTCGARHASSRLLGDLLAGVAWGALDFLLVDLPPGAERTVSVRRVSRACGRVRAGHDSLGRLARRSSRARSRRSRKTPNRILGYVENMKRLLLQRLRHDPAAVRGVGRDRPRHPLSRLGAVRSRSRRRVRSRRRRCPTIRRAPTRRAIARGRRGDPPSHGGDMKFLCVLCDQPMKLVEVAPPDRGALSVVYECPECAHRIAMLTNPLETQMVTSLGVADRPERREDRIEVPVLGMMPGHAGGARRRERPSCRGRPRRSSGSPNDSRFRPSDGARRHRALRPRAGPREVDEQVLEHGQELLRHVEAGLESPCRPKRHDRETSAFARPYVISWNLTYRCNLACEHCYLDAGGKPEVDTEAFADRSELDDRAAVSASSTRSPRSLPTAC